MGQHSYNLLLYLLSIAVLVCLSACVTLESNRVVRSEDAKLLTSCSSNDFDPLLNKSFSFVIFGEIHGTDQAPRIVTSYICHLLKRKKSIQLFLERSVEEQASIDKYLFSKGSIGDKCALLEMSAWRALKQDGRSSVAMFELLDTVRLLKNAGAKIFVTAFSSGDDEQDAKLVRKTLNDKSTDFAVMLVGNVHASKSATSFSANEKYYPLNSYLQDLSPIALNMVAMGGTYWACVGKASCGPQQYPSYKGVQAVPHLSLEPIFADDLSFDGYFSAGQVTASAPAARSICGFGELARELN
jgi:hypothetical protein